MDKEDEARPGRAEQNANLAARALGFDPERYRHHIAHMNMSEAAQAELLAVVWRMMETFVDIAFGDDATQLARIAGDKSSAAREQDGGGTLDSSDANSSSERTLAASFRQNGRGDWKERGTTNAAE